MALSIIVDHCYVEGCYAVANAESHIKTLYAECHYAKCYYAKCYYAKCYYAKCYYAKCYYAKCKYAECRGAMVCPNHKQKTRVCQIF